MRTRPVALSVVVPGLLWLALAGGPAAAADLVWPGEGLPAAAWSATLPAEALVEAVVDQGALVAKGRSEDPWRIERPLQVADGTDQAPLIASCTLAVDGRRPQAHQPTLLRLRWAAGGEVAVGLPAAAVRLRDPLPWAVWRAGAGQGEAAGKGTLFGGPAPCHLRVVVTARRVAADASRDGVNWERLCELDRGPAFAGAPAMVSVGRGLAVEYPAKPGRKPVRKPTEDSVWRFERLAVAAAPAELPASLLKDYRKPDSYEAAREEDEDRGRIRAWKLRGPLPRNHVGEELAEDEGLPEGEGWVEARQGTERGDRVLQVSKLLGKAEQGGVYLAACLVRAEAPRLSLLRFDGTRLVQVFVNGREMARARLDAGELKAGRNAVQVPLRAGDNLIAVRLVASDHGIAALALRELPGDPRARIAWLGRIALDFPGEAEAQVDGRREIARLWEACGNLRAAADALGELAACPDLPGDESDRAAIDRARLLHRLRDAQGVAAVVGDLEARWTGEGAATAARLKAARLWEALGRADEAAKALGLALVDPRLPADERTELAIERLRLTVAAGDDGATAEAARFAADLLPATDGRRAVLLAEAVRRQPAMGATAAPDVRLVGVSATTARAGLLDALAAAEPGNPWSLLRAEELAAARPAQAAQLYRAHAQAAGAALSATAALPALRRDLFLALLGRSPAGIRLRAGILATGAALPTPTADLLDWQVCGPLPTALAVGSPPCDPANPTAGPVAGKAWKPLKANQEGILEPAKAVGESTEAALCAATFDSPRDGEASIACGSDDGLVLWLNGKRVFEDLGLRGVVRDQFRVGVRVKAGRNVVLAAVHNNGGGGWGIQVRPEYEPFPAGPLARFAALLADAKAERAAVAEAGLAVLDRLWLGRQIPECEILAAALARVLPDQAPRVLPRVRALLAEAPQGDPRLRLELAQWMEGVDALAPWAGAPDLFNGQDWRGAAADSLEASGRADEAIAVLERGLCTVFAAADRAWIQYRLGCIHLRRGAATPARQRLLAARDLQPAHQWLKEQLEQNLGLVRGWRGEWLRFDPPGDLLGQLETADHACAGDPAAAAAVIDRLLAERGAQLWPVNERTSAPVSTWVVRRLGDAGEAHLAAWRKLAESTAMGEFATAPAGERERLVARWPFTHAAADALAAAAADHLDRGWAALALADLGVALAAVPGDAQLTAQTLQAAALAGDAAAVAMWKQALERCQGQVERGGRRQAPAEAAAELARLAPFAASAPPADPQPRRLAWALTWEPPVADARHAQVMAAPGLPATPTVQPLVEGGTAYLATGDGVIAVEAAGGALRWRATASGDGRPAQPTAFDGVPEHRAALAAGLVVARTAADGRWRLQAWRAADGRPRWSTGDQGGLAALVFTSSPAACGDAIVALAHRQGRSRVVVLDAASGALRAEIEVPGERKQPATAGWDGRALTGHQPAPLVTGRWAVVDTGCGALAAIDVHGGRIEWLAAYPRIQLDQAAGAGAAALLRQGASTPVRAAGVVVALPRDALALVAVDAATGVARWRREPAGCRRLLAAVGDAVLVQGDGLELVEAASGRTRWRWWPAAGGLRGTAQVGAQAALVAGEAGLHRVRLSDGADLGLIAWTALGLAEAPSNLVAGGGGLLAVGPGLAAGLAGEGSAACRRTAIPAVRDPVQPMTWPIAPGAAAVAPAWFLPGEQAEDLVAVGGDVLVRGRSAILRLEAATGAVRWRTTIPAGAGAQMSADAVVVTDRGWYASLDPATGQVLASAQYEADPEHVFAVEPRLRVHVNEGWLTSLWPWWQQPVEALRLDGGARCRVQVPGHALCAAVLGGRLRVLTSHEDHLWLREHDLATGELLQARRLVKGGWNPAVLWTGQGRYAVSRHHDQAQLIDLQEGAARALDLGDARRELWGVQPTWYGAAPALFTRNGWNGGNAGLIDLATGALRLRTIGSFEPTNTEPPATHRAQPLGDGLVWPCAREVKNAGWRGGVSCAGPDGRERWRWNLPEGEHWHRQVIGVLPWGDRVAVLTRAGHERLHWHLLDAADGKPVSRGALPVWHDGRGGSLQVGDRWLVGGADGLLGLARSAAPMPSATVAATTLASADPAALSATAAATLAGSLPGRVLVGSAPDALAVAVELPDVGPEQGAEGILIGCDPRGRERGGLPDDSLWRLRIADGRTRCERLDGGEAIAVRARAAWSPAGMRYELVIPWPTGTDGRSFRPPAYALGIAARSGSRAGELGCGLLRGVALNAWAVVEWPGAKK